MDVIVYLGIIKVKKMKRFDICKLLGYFNIN